MVIVGWWAIFVWLCLSKRRHALEWDQCSAQRGAATANTRPIVHVLISMCFYKLYHAGLVMQIFDRACPILWHTRRWKYRWDKSEWSQRGGTVCKNLNAQSTEIVQLCNNAMHWYHYRRLFFWTLFRHPWILKVPTFLVFPLSFEFFPEFWVFSMSFDIFFS